MNCIRMVLWLIIIPTIIVEHAFLSNVNDYRNYLSTDAQLDALARADAAGILEAVLQ